MESMDSLLDELEREGDLSRLRQLPADGTELGSLLLQQPLIDIEKLQTVSKCLCDSPPPSPIPSPPLPPPIDAPSLQQLKIDARAEANKQIAVGGEEVEPVNPVSIPSPELPCHQHHQQQSAGPSSSTVEVPIELQRSSSAVLAAAPIVLPIATNDSFERNFTAVERVTTPPPQPSPPPPTVSGAAALDVYAEIEQIERLIRAEEEKGGENASEENALPQRAQTADSIDSNQLNSSPTSTPSQSIANREIIPTETQSDPTPEARTAVELQSVETTSRPPEPEDTATLAQFIPNTNGNEGEQRDYSSTNRDQLSIEAPATTVTDADGRSVEEAVEGVTERRMSVVASTHVISPLSTDEEDGEGSDGQRLTTGFLTESELQLGKTKPYWIPDADSTHCMLCSNRFTLVNRRHHCRSCGRVLCGECCRIRRLLPYMSGERGEKGGRQRICAPCNRTLDRIEQYEREEVEREELYAPAREEEQQQPHLGPPMLGGAQVPGSANAGVQHEEEVGSPTRDELHPQPSHGQPSQPRCPTKPPYVRKSVLKPAKPTPIRAVGIAVEDGGEGTSSSSIFTHLHHPVSASLPTTMMDLSQRGTGGDELGGMAIPNVQTQSKRSVTFRDGVNPGDESAEVGQSAPSPSALDEREEAALMVLNGTARNKKTTKRLSRRAIERRADEEQTSLLPTGLESPRHCYLLKIAERSAEFKYSLLDEVVRSLYSSEESLTVVLKRNLYVVVQQGKLPTSFGDQSVLCYSTRGFSSLGVDELVLVFAIDDTGEDSAANSEARTSEVLDVLQQLEELFGKCLSPTEDTLDDRMGIRRCVNRMPKMYMLSRGRMGGIEAAAVLFHRPQGQVFGDLPMPPARTPFLVGTLLRQEEVGWAIALPMRVLLRLGLHFSHYPVAIANARQRSPLFHPVEETGHLSVLKVFNDFHRWSYRMARLPGSVASLSDKHTTVSIPDWAVDELKTIVENNRSMLGWTLDFNVETDGHLVCEQSERQESEDGYELHTKILTKSTSAEPGKTKTRGVTGASFVVFDGGLKTKQGDEAQFLVSVMEDGVVVRLSADTMEELVKSLLAAQDFRVDSSAMCLEVLFYDSQVKAPKPQVGALVSPIDGRDLTRNFQGHYQYGLVLSRQFRSHSPFPSSTEWSLRLATVINMQRGRFPHLLQPKFFELCEELITHLTPTLQTFVPLLAIGEWQTRRISIRVCVETEHVSYVTEKWADSGELADQHFIWTLALDEHLVPFLYSLCSVSPNGFHVELHAAIISTKPLLSLINSP